MDETVFLNPMTGIFKAPVRSQDGSPRLPPFMPRVEGWCKKPLVR